MHRNNALLVSLFLLSFSLAACSGPSGTGTCPGGVCGPGTGKVAVTMVADTLPANPSFLSFQVTIASITLTPAVGTATTVNLSPARTVDLMRLQTDTAFLGIFGNIPTGQYTNATLTLSGNAIITFLNDTATTISSCPASTICPLTVTASSNPVAAVSYVVSQNGVTGIGIDLNIFSAVSIVQNALAVNFSNANVLSAFTLPRAGSNLASGQLDLIEDFTGVASLGSSSVTVSSAASTGHGSLVAAANSSTLYDPDPTGIHCPTGTTQLSQCVSSNQAVSMDAVLNSDGTLSIQEIEPLLATLQDTVEGTVVVINQTNQTQFTLIVTDIIPAAQASLIGGLKIGDGLSVNLVNNNPFLVDTKGLPVQSSFGSNFQSFFGQTNTTAIHLGQTVAVHVTAFTAAAGITIASSNTDTVTLRWSRFTATTSSASDPAFSITGFPSSFNATGIAEVEVFSNTNLDGIASTSNLAVGAPVAMRALFIENSGDSLNPAFYAAKVRQH
jgi:hypothetical protein